MNAIFTLSFIHEPPNHYIYNYTCSRSISCTVLYCAASYSVFSSAQFQLNINTINTDYIWYLLINKTKQ